MTSNSVWQAKNSKLDYFTLIDPKIIHIKSKILAELISMKDREDEDLHKMRFEGAIQNTQADRSVQKCLQYFLANKIIPPERASLRHL